jgi:prepilin peptidase CpaA
MSQMVLAALVAVFPILVVFAAASDFFTMTISNRVSGGLMLAGLAALAVTHPGWVEAGYHFAAGAAVFAVGFFFFARGWMGGGDVKFAAAIAFWLGWGHVLDFAFGFSIFGGLLTLLVLVADRALAPIPALKFGFLVRFHEHRRVPYGVALSISAMLVFAETDWMKAFLFG